MADTKLADLPAGTLDAGALLYAVNDPGGTPVDVKVTRENLISGIVSNTSVAIGFDGDSFVRKTINDSAVSTSSRVFVSVQRDAATDGDDLGLVYVVNVVTVRNGSFDVVVSVQDWGQGDPVGTLTGEFINLIYLVG